MATIKLEQIKLLENEGRPLTLRQLRCTSSTLSATQMIPKLRIHSFSSFAATFKSWSTGLSRKTLTVVAFSTIARYRSLELETLPVNEEVTLPSSDELAIVKMNARLGYYMVDLDFHSLKFLIIYFQF